MTELEKATAILAAALGVATPDVAETLQSDTAVESVTAELDKKFKNQYDHGNKQAINKTRRDVERAFKAAGVEDASFDNLPAAIEAVQGAAAEAASAEPGKGLTDEQVLRLQPVVQALNAEKKLREQAVADARKDEQQKLADERKQFTKAQVAAKVRAEAERLEADLTPNYTPGREDVQRKKFIDELVALNDYTANGDSFDITDADGNLLPGKMDNPLKFEDRVRQKADHEYGLPASKPKAAPGVQQPQADGGANAGTRFTGDKPKDAAAYAALLPTLPPEQQKELQEWRKAEKPF